MVEATQESTAIQNSLDYNDPKHRNWSLSWSSFGLAWVPLSYWKKFDVVINWSEMKDIRPGYDLKVFNGIASDQYPVNFTSFGLNSRIIEITVLNHPLDVIFSRNNSDILVGYQIQGGYVDLLYANSFKLKNANPGYDAQYQIVVIN